jgi:SpoVK/Ycf46/Vps4 family AAA+-type ATPase
MKYTTLKINKIIDLEEGASLPLLSGQFQFIDGKIVTYDFNVDSLEEAPTPEIEDSLKEILKEQEKARQVEEQEFINKFQIRPGQWLFRKENGLSNLPVVEEKFYETDTSKAMKSLFNNFFQKSEKINSKYKKNKRAYLLYSEPGMGKSALIRHFCRETLKTKGTAVLQVDGDVDFAKLTEIFLKPYAEEVERIILIIEDFGRKDYANNTNLFNSSCLNFLDGVAGLFRVPTLIICTTNFIKELGPQLTNRPGRFSKLIKVVPPSDNEAFDLIENVSGIQLTDMQKEVFRGLEMSPDHILEALIRHELENIPLELAAQEVMQERMGINPLS